MSAPPLVPSIPGRGIGVNPSGVVDRLLSVAEGLAVTYFNLGLFAPPDLLAFDQLVRVACRAEVSTQNSADLARMRRLVAAPRPNYGSGMLAEMRLRAYLVVLSGLKPLAISYA